MDTSEKIVDFLRNRGQCSVPEIARSLNLTRAAIRYHLGFLITSNRVNSTGHSEKTHRRGRPSVEYEIKQELTQENLIVIANIFSSYLLSSKSIPQIADEIWQCEIQSFSPSASPINRINEVLKFLNRLAVKASWVAGKSGPHIQIIHNPYEKENPQPYHSVMDSLIKKAVDYVVNE